MVVSAAALATGDYTPETPIPAPDLLTLPGTSTTMENFDGESCNGGADQPLIDALTISCNTAFAQLGIDLGEDAVRDMSEAFGINDERFEMPLPVAASKLGDIENDAQLGISSIGQQDVQLTPMQAAMIASAVANDGTLMKPYLVSQVQAPDLTVIDKTDPEEFGQPVSEEVAGQLTEMMLSVVENGTGQRAQIEGVQVAGKTGTAENSRRGPLLVHRLRPGGRPDHRRRRLHPERWPHRRRHLRPDRPLGDPGPPRRTGGLMALAVGSLLAGRYEITAPIATGGMGEVWKARDRVLDRIVAAKVLKSEFTGDPSFLARFRNEARHTAALTHQNIASVFDYGETVDDTGTQQLAFLVMEFVEGQPLVTILHDEGALPVDWTLHVLSQSADGLSAAHKAGVVHRDIKPGNLMVRPDGVVKLTDFGIAQARDATPLTRTGMVVGTAQYLSPEQAQGMVVTSASDVYSLGVVAYECLCGARPFDGASQVAIALAHINRPPPPLPSHVPPAVRLLVERALAKDPADRFPDGGAFAEAIRRVAAGGTLAPVPPAGPRTTPTQAVAGGALAGGAVAGAALTGASLAASRTQVIPATGPGALAAAGGPMTGPARPMPPLQAPPDDDDWDAEDDDGRRGGRAKWMWLSAAVVLLLVLAGGTWFLLNDGNRGSDGASGGTTASQTSAAPTGIELSAAFIGRPADEVQTELEAAGLVVRQEEADDDVLASSGQALDAGDVAGLDPSSGFAQPGTQVVLFVASDAFTPEDDEEEPTATTESTTTAQTTQTTTATTTTSDPPPPTTETTLPGTEEPPPSEDPPPVEPDPNAEAVEPDGVG